MTPEAIDNAAYPASTGRETADDPLGPTDSPDAAEIEIAEKQKEYEHA